MSKIDLVRNIIESLTLRAADAGDAGYSGVALLLFEAKDILQDLLDAGVDPEDLAPDDNERLREIWQLVYAETGAVAFTIGATSLVASAGLVSGGLVIGVSAFLLAEVTTSFLSFMADEWGITPTGQSIDFSNLGEPVNWIATVADDQLTSTEFDDTFALRSGIDTLEIIGGSNVVDGGDGLDTVSYRELAGNAGIVLDNRGAPDALTVFHGMLQDTLTNVEIVIGTDRADTFLLGNLGHNLAPGLFDGYIREVDAGAGDDVVFIHNEGGAGPQRISIAGGTEDIADLLVVGDDGFTTFIDLEAGTARYSGGPNANFDISGFEDVLGGDGVDNVTGDDRDNYIDTGAGNDRVDGGGGNDLIDGGADTDVIRGDEGDDIIQGQSGRDRLFGGDDDDLIFAFEFDGTTDDSAADRIWGNSGDDIIVGGDGADTLRGQGGNDLVLGGGGQNTIYGGGGQDYIVSTGDGDDVYGGNGNDWINAQGSEGNTTVFVDRTSGRDFIEIDNNGYSGVSKIVFEDILSTSVSLIWDYDILSSEGSLEYDIEDIEPFEFGGLEYSETWGGFAVLRVDGTNTSINLGYVSGSFSQTLDLQFVEFEPDGTPVFAEIITTSYDAIPRADGPLTNLTFSDRATTDADIFRLIGTTSSNDGFFRDTGLLSPDDIVRAGVGAFDNAPNQFRNNFDNQFANDSGVSSGATDIASILNQDALDQLGTDVFAFV